MRAPSEGYTLLLVTSTNVINTTFYEKLSFDLILRIPANADSDSDRLRTAIPIDRGQRSGDRGQRLPSTASRAHSAVSVSSLSR